MIGLDVGTPFWCQAIYSWSGDSPDDLNFTKGDVIQCLDVGDGKWWTGKLLYDDKVAFFPSNYVRVVRDKTQAQNYPKDSDKRHHSMHDIQFESGLEYEIGNDFGHEYRQEHGVNHGFGARHGHGHSYSTYEIETNSYTHNNDLNHYKNTPRGRQSSQSLNYLPSSSVNISPLAEPTPAPLPPPHRVVYQKKRYFDIETENNMNTLSNNAKSYSRSRSSTPVKYSFDGINTTPDMGVRKRSKSLSSEKLSDITNSMISIDQSYKNSSKTISDEKTNKRNFPKTASDYMGDIHLSNVSNSYKSVNPQSELRRIKSSVEGNSTDLSRANTHRSISNFSTTNMSDTTEATEATNFSTFSATSAASFQRHRMRQRASTMSDSITPAPLPSTTGNMMERKSSKTKLKLKKSASFLRRLFSKQTSSPVTPIVTATHHDDASSDDSNTYFSDTSSNTNRPHSVYSSDISSTSASSRALSSTVSPVSSRSRPKSLGFDQMGRQISNPIGISSSYSLSSRNSSDIKTNQIGNKKNTSSISSTLFNSDNGKSSFNKSFIKSPDWISTQRLMNRANSLCKNELSDRRKALESHEIECLKPFNYLYMSENEIDPTKAKSKDENSINGFESMLNMDFKKIDKLVEEVHSFNKFQSLDEFFSMLLQQFSYLKDIEFIRLIFMLFAEKFTWEQGNPSFLSLNGKFQPSRECVNEASTRIFQTKKASPYFLAVLINELCGLLGIKCEVVLGYIKSPGEVFNTARSTPVNHAWNAIQLKGEWRIIDSSVASISHPWRNRFVSQEKDNSIMSLLENFGLQSSFSRNVLTYFFMAEPKSVIYTHVPIYTSQQHILPSIDTKIIFNLPFKGANCLADFIKFIKFDNSLINLWKLDVCQIDLEVPPMLNIYAQVEYEKEQIYFGGVNNNNNNNNNNSKIQGSLNGSRNKLLPGYDDDGIIVNGSSNTLGTIIGDTHFTSIVENGDIRVFPKCALAQAFWRNGKKFYRIKAVLPPGKRTGNLKIYVGLKEIGTNVNINQNNSKSMEPGYIFGLTYHARNTVGKLTEEEESFEFMERHFTPHALLYDVYVKSPQCYRLSKGSNIRFIFREFSARSNLPVLEYRPAKLAIRAPNGKIYKLSRRKEVSKLDDNDDDDYDDDDDDNNVDDNANKNHVKESEAYIWETNLKCNDAGIWRGLILADKSVSWCVFCEWKCE